jgi:hypothetical protein
MVEGELGVTKEIESDPAHPMSGRRVRAYGDKNPF